MNRIGLPRFKGRVGSTKVYGKGRMGLSRTDIKREERNE